MQYPEVPSIPSILGKAYAGKHVSPPCLKFRKSNSHSKSHFPTIKWTGVFVKIIRFAILKRLMPHLCRILTSGRRSGGPQRNRWLVLKKVYSLLVNPKFYLLFSINPDLGLQMKVDFYNIFFFQSRFIIKFGVVSCNAFGTRLLIAIWGFSSLYNAMTASNNSFTSFRLFKL